MTKILVIEDEAILCSEVMEWLSLEGYETFGAQDGVEGVDIAQRELPDLIICDIMMPRLDGYGVLMELHSNELTDDIPIMFLTAKAAYDDFRAGMDLGADDYITKPFTRMQLLSAIHTRLDKRKIQEQKREHEVEMWRNAFEQERAQRLMKARLIAMLSHDLRNPLSIILSSEGLLRKFYDRMDERRRSEQFNRIENSVRQLTQMLDDMLIVAQMESGSLEISYEAVDGNEFFSRIVDEFRGVHGDRRTLIYESSSTQAIQSDTRMLRQIASNLISNAIKYSQPETDIIVRYNYVEGTGWISVQDHGIGIPEADQAHLFDPFHRGSNVGGISGTGLGLAIVKQAVSLLNGTISVESVVGEGTTVTIKFPATPC
ncbi:MAG: ATP-binding protein [Anaerolineae bacterium]